MTDERPSLAGPSVVAYTTEDDGRAEVRQAAEAHARDHGCVVILYAGDVASAFSEPIPNQWASDGEAAQYSDRLDSNDLEVLGRAAIGEQVGKGRRAGVTTAAWLPKDKGPKALADYALAQRAHIVFVPADLDSLAELRPLLAIADDRPQTQIEIHVVERLSSAR